MMWMPPTIYEIPLATTREVYRDDAIADEPNKETNEEKIDVREDEDYDNQDEVMNTKEKIDVGEAEAYDNLDELENTMFQNVFKTSFRDKTIGGSSGADASEGPQGTDFKVQSLNVGINAPTDGVYTYIGFPFTSIIVLLFYFGFLIFYCI